MSNSLPIVKFAIQDLKLVSLINGAIVAKPKYCYDKYFALNTCFRLVPFLKNLKNVCFCVPVTIRTCDNV